jgi:hypothetical protein
MKGSGQLEERGGSIPPHTLFLNVTVIYETGRMVVKWNE